MAATERYANQEDFGLQIDLDIGHAILRFVVGEPRWYRHGGWCWSSGEIRLANGQRFWAIHEICERDAGEHWGTIVPYRGEVRDQEEGFVGFLAERQQDVFPFRYRYDAYIPNDHHVGRDGVEPVVHRSSLRQER
jgi:hypothetical protein